ncbi:MAG: CapA family protein, partial [Gemmatimonadetes bacterium]|nr:CapA family protein [Gemmatimonadota bacterium]NIR79557.1 CapA family protein [Gemmatimonadota bacterium]NIT88236.1 CapA family protein [Gemmatimonadota bacterium]NIU32044.1 CapA family protein [Gemmatimonadota bacterium]NIU36653.1 CapA family protein [Gemmatimonadota bacterium]
PADNYERYGLGNEHLPSEFYDTRENRSGGGFPVNPLIWEGVVAVTDFRGGELAEVRLHPVTLGHGLPRPQRGRPLLAKGDLGEKILGDIQRLSEP